MSAIKLYDKKAALDAIARHLGMFPAGAAPAGGRAGSRGRRRTRVRYLHAAWLASLPKTAAG